MTAIVVGFVFIALGVWGLLNWFQDFVFMLKGLGPITLIVSGLVALIVGLGSFSARQHGKPKD
jgi:hypothetical protein